MIPDLSDALPKGFRVNRSDPDCLALSYRTKGMGCLGVFLVVWSLGWFACVIDMMWGGKASSVDAGRPPLFLQALFWGCGIGGLAIFFWHFFATTVLLFRTDRLIAERSLGPYRRRREIEKSRIRCVVQVKDGGVGEDSFPSWGLAVAGDVSFKVLSRQRVEKSAWLGPVVAAWAGVPFVPWVTDTAALGQAIDLAPPAEADLSRPPTGFRLETADDGNPVIVRGANGMGCLIPFLLFCFVVWVCPSVIVFLGLVTSALLAKPDTVLWLVAAAVLAGEFAFLRACLLKFFAETRFTLAPDRLLVQRRFRRTRTWWEMPRKSVRKVRQAGHYDEGSLTDCDLEVTGGIDTRTLLRHQSVEKGAWLGSVIAQWADQPFVSLVCVLDRVYETI